MTVKTSKFLKKRRHYVILILLVVLNVILRIPTTPHMVFRDSYATALLTNEILSSENPESRSIEWNLKPDLISFGYTFPPIYPLSLVELIQFCGFAMETASAYYSILLGILGLLTAYVMAREFFGLKSLTYLTAFAYSTAPVFTSTTKYTLLSRGLFTAILPLFLWTLIRYDKSKDEKFLLYSLTLALSLYLTHRMGLLLALFYLAYFSSKIIKNKLKNTLPIAYTLVMVSLILWSMESNISVIPQVRLDYSKGFLINGESLKTRLLNLAVDYYSKIGFLSFFTAIGLGYSIFGLGRSSQELDFFFATTVLFFAPFLVVGEYTILVLLPIFSLVTARGLLFFLEMTSRFAGKKTLMVFVLTFITASTLFTVFMVEHWLTVESRHHMTLPHWVDERVIHAAAYFKQIEGDILTPKFPDFTTELLYYYGVDERFRFSWIDYAFKNIGGGDNRVSFVVESETLEGRFYGPYDKIVPSPLLVLLYEGKDKVYSNGLIVLWRI